MSNHSGSYMLNSMLVMLERESYFSEIGPEMTEEFVLHVVGLAYEYDGNPGKCSTASVNVSAFATCVSSEATNSTAACAPRATRDVDYRQCPITSTAS